MVSGKQVNISYHAFLLLVVKNVDLDKQETLQFLVDHPLRLNNVVALTGSGDNWQIILKLPKFTQFSLLCIEIGQIFLKLSMKQTDRRIEKVP